MLYGTGFAALSFHSRAAHIQRKVKVVKDISVLVETWYVYPEFALFFLSLFLSFLLKLHLH